MSHKIDLPALAGPLSQAAVPAWLNNCADTFEMLAALNANTSSLLTTRAQITLAGLKMTDATAAAWWNENRDELKDLGAWEEFAARVRDRFVPTGWKLDALERFYAVKQGTGDFRVFVAELQAARNNLANAVSAELTQHFGDRVFRTIVPRNVRLAEAPSHGQSIVAYDKASRGSVAYLGLAGEVLRRQREREQAAKAPPQEQKEVQA